MNNSTCESVIELLDQRTQLFIKFGSKEGTRNVDLYHAAQQLKWNLIPIDYSRDILIHAANLCVPPLPERESIASVDSAYRTRGDPTSKVVSYLSSIGIYFETNKEKYTLPPANYTLREWYEACWLPGESILITSADQPQNSIEVNLEYLVSNHEVVDSFPVASIAGVYCTYNPIKGKRCDANVVNYRHVIIEFDKLSMSDQWKLVKDSNVPVSAAIFSGGKSIHFWVRVNAINAEDYKSKCSVILSAFPDVDKSVLHPGGWSRLPCAKRGSNTQNIIAINMGASTWEEWEDSLEEEPEDNINARTWLKTPEPAVDEIVEGSIHRGSRVILAGPSKSHKSWALEDLAISVASGTPWMGYPTKKSKVIIVNMEVMRKFLQDRIINILKAKGINEDDLEDNLNIIHRRGKPASSEEVAKIIHRRVCKLKNVSMVIIDPVYKMLNGLDENKAGDIAKLMNTFDELSFRNDISIVFAAHFSKGDATAKESIDRISGSGVFARDPDSLFMVTPVEVKGEAKGTFFKFDSHLRHHWPLETSHIAWKFPLFHRIDTLPSPKVVKAKKTAKEVKIKASRIDYKVVARRLMGLIYQVDNKKALVDLCANNGITYNQLRTTINKMRCDGIDIEGTVYKIVDKLSYLDVVDSNEVTVDVSKLIEINKIQVVQLI